MELMAAIIPAILPTSREDLDARLLRLSGVTDEVQVDVVDGRFVTPASWPYAGQALGNEDPLTELSSFRFEVDLMVEEPDRIIGRWIDAGATRITIHAESTRRLEHVIDDFQKKYGHDKDFAPQLLSLGLSLNIATDISLIEPFLDRCDYVQFMGIARIGKQGEPFDPRVIPKIKAFHRAHPEMPIQIDGGVTRETAPKLLEAGASRLVIGSALWRASNIKREFVSFCELSQTRGLYTYSLPAGTFRNDRLGVMEDVVFEEERRYTTQPRQASLPSSKGGLLELVIQLRLAKDNKGAERVLLITAVAAVVITIAIFIWSGTSEYESPEPVVPGIESYAQ